MFDAVFVTRDTGPSLLSPAEFLALPLTERVRSLLENKVEFRRNGAAVPQVEALKSLMQYASRGA